MNAMANNNTADRPTAKVSYRDTLKSMDTEEHIDLAFYRPIGYMWACLAKRLGVTPNAITIASIFLGIGAGIMFYFPDMWLNVAGMLLLVWANSFDSADGQLARMTKQYSRLGRILDGLSGDLLVRIDIYRHMPAREYHIRILQRPPMGDMGSSRSDRSVPY